MSAIAGIVRLDDGGVSQADLAPLLAALRGRGPDRQRTWIGGPAGLLHGLFETAPEPPQPLEEFGLVAVVDGRIDDLPLLSRLAGRPLPSAPEAVLALYRLRADRAFPLLLGDFAAAVWDPGRGRLVLARDAVGVKPLFYALAAGRLAFASEAEALLALPGVPRTPDAGSLASLERGRGPSGDRTFFSAVRRLMPGHCLVAEGGRVRTTRYWRPSASRRVRLAGREAYRRRFRELFVESVRSRLPARGAVAVRLSGGLDSTAVAGACADLARRERPDVGVVAVSMVSDLVPDERHHMREACEALGLTPELFRAEDVDLAAGLQTSARRFADPLVAPLALCWLRAHELAAAKGARVVLGGEWGDPVTTRRAHLADLLREGRLRAFWRELRLFPAQQGGTAWDVLRFNLWYLLFPAGVRDAAGPESPDWLGALLGRAGEPAAFPSASQSELYDEVFGGRLAQVLELYDRLASAAGVELRFPFLDRRLLVFSMAVPAEELVRDGRGRRLVRESLGGILPESVASRRDKWDLGALTRSLLERVGVHAGGEQEALDAWTRRLRGAWEAAWTRSTA